MAAVITGMLSWVIGVALIPLDAKLEKGEQHLVQVLRAHTSQLYVAALLAALGAVLLVAFFAVLTRLVPDGHPGWGLLRVSLAGACSFRQWYPSGHRPRWSACTPRPGVPAPGWLRWAGAGCG
jgi:hypothetical protein